MSNTPAVCHIPPDNNIEQPGPHNVTSVSPAQPNIQSLVNTVNQLRTIIIQLQNRRTQWVEKGRITQLVTITDPSGSGASVTFEQINRLTMVDRLSGQTWDWIR